MNFMNWLEKLIEFPMKRNEILPPDPMRATMTGKKVRLVGKTIYGENRIKQYGEIWEILDLPVYPHRIQRFGDRSETDLALRSLNNKDWRRVDEWDDPNFKVIRLEDDGRI